MRTANTTPFKQCRDERVVTVMLVADHPAVRYSVDQAFADRRDIALLLSSASASNAVLDATQVDVAIVDHERTDGDGLALARTLATLPHAPKVLVLTAYPDVRMTLATARAGAAGVVSKAASGEELCQAVVTVAEGARHLAPITAAAAGGVLASLPPLERLITAMLLAGAEERVVAEILGLAPQDLDATCPRVLATIDSLGDPPTAQRSHRESAHARGSARRTSRRTALRGARSGAGVRRAASDPDTAKRSPRRLGIIERATMQRVEVG